MCKCDTAWKYLLNVLMGLIISHYIDRLVQERRNSNALAMELRFFLHSPTDIPIYQRDSLDA